MWLEQGRQPGAVQAPSGVAAFPGGSVKRMFGDGFGPGACTGIVPVASLLGGFDFGKMVFDVTRKADGATGAATGGQGGSGAMWFVFVFSVGLWFAASS